eukprot:XP_011682553.1 PREDICTED: uncharacterized protein LOC105446871 [Strongylocentrotus purpuratus]
MSSFLISLVAWLLVLHNVSGDVCIAPTVSDSECQCDSAPPQLPSAPRFYPSIPNCGNSNCDSWTQECDNSTMTCGCRFDPNNSDEENCRDPCFDRCNRSTDLCVKTHQGFLCQANANIDGSRSFYNNIAKRDIFIITGK